MNFENDLRQQFANWLSMNDYPADGDLRALVIRYQNITRRIPPRSMWKLRISRKLAARKLPRKIKDGLSHFMEQARSSEDLRPFLSSNIKRGDYKDLMFYDWGIYHFHLGSKKARHGNRRGFIEGSDELLFAITDPMHSTMYLIDVHPHKNGFTNQDLLHIIEENWPEILTTHSPQGISPSYEDLSDAELGMFRRSGVNVALGTPGGRTVIGMGGGITTAKTSMQDVVKADKLVCRIRQAEERFKATVVSIERYLEHEHGVPKYDLLFRAHLDGGDTIWVVETGTGLRVWNEQEGRLIQTLEVDL